MNPIFKVAAAVMTFCCSTLLTAQTWEDFVDVDALLACECELNLDPVCVDLGVGMTFPAPNACVAECLALPVVEGGECMTPEALDFWLAFFEIDPADVEGIDDVEELLEELFEDLLNDAEDDDAEDDDEWEGGHHGHGNHHGGDHDDDDDDWDGGHHGHGNHHGDDDDDEWNDWNDWFEGDSLDVDTLDGEWEGWGEWNDWFEGDSLDTDSLEGDWHPGGHHYGGHHGGNCSADNDDDEEEEDDAEVEEVMGCMAEDACNYNPEATVEDESCDFTSCLVFGCDDVMACNYDPEVDYNDGSCTYALFPYGCDGLCINDLDGDGVCDELEVPGCTDEMACNYNPEATDSEDNCTYAEGFLDCSGACVNDADGDGVCDELEVPGCLDVLACNYAVNATDADDSCEYADEFYDCDGNCLNDADGDGICDELELDDHPGVSGDGWGAAQSHWTSGSWDHTHVHRGQGAHHAANPQTREGGSELDGLKAYPNPASVDMTVQVPGWAQHLCVVSLTGQRVQEVPVSEVGMFQVNVAQHRPGSYLLVVEGQGNRMVQPIVIQH